MKPFNLQKLLSEDRWLGLRIDLSQAMLLRELTGDEDGPFWRADIYQRRNTKSGNEGTPKPITTIVSNSGESPADLLRTVAAIYEQGHVEVTK